MLQGTNFPGVMSSAAGAVARWIAPFLTVAAVACVGLVADPVHVGPAPAVRLAADEANPLAGAPFYVNPTSAAMRAAQSADPPSPELDRHREHAAGVLDRPGLFRGHGREVHR